MDDKRYQEANTGDCVLTQSEIDEGWHFCYEWDCLLVGPEMEDELAVCTCLPDDHEVYSNKNKKNKPNNN